LWEEEREDEEDWGARIFRRGPSGAAPAVHEDDETPDADEERLRVMEQAEEWERAEEWELAKERAALERRAESGRLLEAAAGEASDWEPAADMDPAAEPAFPLGPEWALEPVFQQAGERGQRLGREREGESHVLPPPPDDTVVRPIESPPDEIVVRPIDSPPEGDGESHRETAFQIFPNRGARDFPPEDQPFVTRRRGELSGKAEKAEKAERAERADAHDPGLRDGEDPAAGESGLLYADNRPRFAPGSEHMEGPGFDRDARGELDDEDWGDVARFGSPSGKTGKFDFVPPADDDLLLGDSGRSEREEEAREKAAGESAADGLAARDRARLERDVRELAALARERDPGALAFGDGAGLPKPEAGPPRKRSRRPGQKTSPGRGRAGAADSPPSGGRPAARHVREAGGEAGHEAGPADAGAGDDRPEKKTGPLLSPRPGSGELGSVVRGYGFSEHVIVGRLAYIDRNEVAGHKVVNCKVAVYPWRKVTERRPTWYEVSVWDNLGAAFARCGFGRGDQVLFRLDNVRVQAWTDKFGNPRASIKGAADKFLDLRPSEMVVRALAEELGRPDVEREIKAGLAGPSVEDNPWISEREANEARLSDERARENAGKTRGGPGWADGPADPDKPTSRGAARGTRRDRDPGRDFDRGQASAGAPKTPGPENAPVPPGDETGDSADSPKPSGTPGPSGPRPKF
jgi:hypothetical protein